MLAEPQIFYGVDVGAETVKVVVLTLNQGLLQIQKRRCREHGKDPYGVLRQLLLELGWSPLHALAATGRLSRGLDCLRVPVKAALARGARFVCPEHSPGTIVSIGSQGFSVLELRGGDQDVYRENSRCSQGTGNFLCQLVERFGLGIDEASQQCVQVDRPASLSGRCPVILKTDMTHLANKGEKNSAIIAGLYDAVCENVQSLIKPGVSPEKVILTGGVTQAPRVRNNFRSFLHSRGMSLIEPPEDAGRYLEALGAALVAFEQQATVAGFDALIKERHATVFDPVPPLRDALANVSRIPATPTPPKHLPRRVVLGVDIGSTGAKALALDSVTLQPVWEAYLDTLGAPVTAAQNLVKLFLEETDPAYAVCAVGVTGSGRDIVGSLMASCFGAQPIVVMNEIAAHAEGALYYDRDVDTIFEIGGQDAKYTRLEDGHIIDAAMNEACSAGTGSFIAEQGSRFDGVSHVVDMNRIAMGAEFGVSLGQHCSVFMAEVIADAVADNVPQPAIIAGLYDSIAQNYLNRVKGNRSVGQRIFCQGMPFKSDALAAAMARRTGQLVIVPPNPGTMGALGIALIAAREVEDSAKLMDLRRFLDVRMVRKDTFVCTSTKGCGGTGNRCRIDRIKTIAGTKEAQFLWGGNCSLYDRGTRRKKLPDRTPDPFRERRELIGRIVASAKQEPGRPTIALVEEFSLKRWLPFFVQYFDELGLNTKVFSDEGLTTLKRGVEVSNVPFCAPMQMYQGIVAGILAKETSAKETPEYVFVPRVRELPRHAGELHAVTCPIVQASPDIVSWTGRLDGAHILTPRVDMGPENMKSARFMASVRALARELGAEAQWQKAYRAGCEAQQKFESTCYDLGRQALAFASRHQLPAVIVLGRSYTIHNSTLNANVPNLLREQGALAIPLDCYPVEATVPVFPGIYWGSAQASLRAAHQIRRSPGQYAIHCSNYSCGPDSFSLHFFSYIMENKPFSIIETDGHSGDAGTKTRIEAFLYCVAAEEEKNGGPGSARRVNDFAGKDTGTGTIVDVRNSGEVLLIPRMGPCAETIAALLCADGGRAEAVPAGTRESLRMARKYTSGKECLPLAITLGGLLERVRQGEGTDERFAFLMPKANGPCRFGVYNLFQKIVLEKCGLAERVRLISPSDEDYFSQVPVDFQIRALACFVATDMLQAALHDVRPVEKAPGLAQAIYDRYIHELKEMMVSTGTVSTLKAFGSVFGRVFGIEPLLKRAGRDFAQVKDFSRNIPSVAVVGEIYVRLDSFANDHLIEKLEERGLRCLLAPFSEWLLYCTLNEFQRSDEGCPLPGDRKSSALLTRAIQRQIVGKFYAAMANPLKWKARTKVEEIVRAADPYISHELIGEAVLSLGGPVHDFLHGHIDGAVSVGPHECMPNKVVESQFYHVQEKTGLITLNLAVNGDPIDLEILDRFAFEGSSLFQVG